MPLPMLTGIDSPNQPRIGDAGVTRDGPDRGQPTSGPGGGDYGDPGGMLETATARPAAAHPADNTISTDISDEIRSGLPTVDTSIDPSQFSAEGVTELAPPEDIDAAQIGDYTPYTAVTDEVDADSTVEGRLSGLLSQNNPYIERARTEAARTANRRGMLNSSMAAGAAEGAAIDRALPIAQQDARAHLEQQFLNQGYSNDEAKHLADASIQRENLQAGLEQDTNQFNQTNTLENERINAAEQNKVNFATHTADLQAQLAGIDNELALNLETLSREYGIIENLDTIGGSIYKQLIGDIGSIMAGEDKIDVAMSKINNLIISAGVEFEFSNGQRISPTYPGDTSGGQVPTGDSNMGDALNNVTTQSGGGNNGTGYNAPDGGGGTDVAGLSGTLGGMVTGESGIDLGIKASDIAAVAATGNVLAMAALGVGYAVQQMTQGAVPNAEEAAQINNDLDTLAAQLNVTRVEVDNMSFADLAEVTRNTINELPESQVGLPPSHPIAAPTPTRTAPDGGGGAAPGGGANAPGVNNPTGSGFTGQVGGGTTRSPDRDRDGGGGNSGGGGGPPGGSGTGGAPGNSAAGGI